MRLFALGIAVEILFVRNEQKDWNEKPGRRQRPNKITLTLYREIKKRLERKNWPKATPNKTILASFHVSPNRTVKQCQILD